MHTAYHEKPVLGPALRARSVGEDAGMFKLPSAGIIPRQAGKGLDAFPLVGNRDPSPCFQGK